MQPTPLPTISRSATGPVLTLYLRNGDTFTPCPVHLAGSGRSNDEAELIYSAVCALVDALAQRDHAAAMLRDLRECERKRATNAETALDAVLREEATTRR